MPITTVERFVAAPAELVFHAITDVASFPELSPDVVGVEFLSEVKQGAGTRFRETRLVGGTEQAFELELTEYDAEAHTARFVTVAGGTVWDTHMAVLPDGDGCRLRTIMHARPQNVLARFMNWVARSVVRGKMEDHLTNLVARCEMRAAEQEGA